MIVPMALISGVIPLRTTDQIYIGSVLSRPVRKNVTGISSNDSVKEISAEPIRAVRIFGSVIKRNVCQGRAPASAEASSSRRSNRCRRANRLVTTIAVKAVPCPMITVHRLKGILSIEKKLRIETPVIIPGKVIGRRTSLLKICLPGNSKRSSAKAVGMPMRRHTTTVEQATMILFQSAVKRS